MSSYSQAHRTPRALFPKPYADAVQRLRVPCGFILLTAFSALAAPTAGSLVAGLPLGVLGLLLRGWASGHLAKNRELAVSGPYAHIRNPLYLGTLIAAAGIVIASRSVWLSILFAVAFLLIYLPAVELEEQHLRSIFPAYADYAVRVRRFLPSLKYTAVPHRFSWALYRRNEEYKALLGFLLAVAWLVWRTVRL